MIKLATIIGHGINLIPHFIEHYKNYVDEICIAVYVTDNHPNIEKEIDNIIKDYDNVKKIITVRDRIYDWGKVTSLYNYVKNQSPNNWWVIADIDEFHLYSHENLYDITNECNSNGWEIVRGGFIDRIGVDGTFPIIKEKESIWRQFPNAGFFRYPMSKACPNKVCIMKGYVPITAGQHYAMINEQTTWRWQGWQHPLIAPIEKYSVQVHHFKWDETVGERIKSVANLNQDYAYSDEYRIMYRELAKSRFHIDLNNKEFMFESTNGEGKFTEYKNWNKLIKKIISI